MPGQLTICRRRYVRYFGDSPRERLTRTIACRLPWFMHAWPVIGEPVRHWRQISEVLQFGCLNPAVVLDARAGLVAVFTNLSNNEDAPTPVVRIIQERLHWIDPAPPADGTLLAAACVYWRRAPNAPHADWDDFSPIVVDCLVDAAQGRAAAERIKPTAWKALDIAVASLANRAEPGLYDADVPPVLVRSCF